MEFAFSINTIFPCDICMVDKGFIASRKFQKEQIDQLCQVVDEMGVHSAKAQNLHGAITSASKMKYSDHHLYVMKDEEANNGKGAVIGIIKVGSKKLFVYDRDGEQHEMQPLCVLDFYVHESRQRHGCGKKLFQHMLQAENIKPQKLAIDRPSHKFISFLQKHYGLKSTIPQVNNFVVFDGFFGNRHDNRLKEFGRRSGIEAGRQLSIDRQREALSNVHVQRQSSFEKPLSERQFSAARGFQSEVGRAMGAQHSMYSRHTREASDDQPERRVNPSDTFQSAVLRNDTPVTLPQTELERTEKSNNKAQSPPLLSRNGPSKEYASLLNNHHNYLDRGGRMKIPLDSPSTDCSSVHHTNVKEKLTPFSREERHGVASQNASWTPTRYGNSSPQFNPKYQQTRLW